MLYSSPFRGVVLALALVGLVGGCRSMRVDHASDPGADFGAYHTFDWRAIPDDLDDPLMRDPDLAFRLQSRIRETFEAKGYEKVERNADITIAFHVALDQRITRAYVDRWGYRYPAYRRPGRPGVWIRAVDRYEVGTLVIDVIDARTDELVWRGVASDAVSSSARGRLEQVDEAVQRILAPFPMRR